MAGEGLILRVQDAMGRGPWKPGLSEKWSDPDRVSGPPPVYHEVEDFFDLVGRWHRRGHHIGCAAKGPEGIRLWFTRDELKRLLFMGYDMFDFSKADIVVETATQVVIASKIAFRKFPRALLKIDDIYMDEGSMWAAS